MVFAFCSPLVHHRSGREPSQALCQMSSRQCVWGRLTTLTPVVEEVAQGRVERNAWSPSDLFRDAGRVAEQPVVVARTEAVGGCPYRYVDLGVMDQSVEHFLDRVGGTGADVVRDARGAPAAINDR